MWFDVKYSNSTGNHFVDYKGRGAADNTNAISSIMVLPNSYPIPVTCLAHLLSNTLAFNTLFRKVSLFPTKTLCWKVVKNNYPSTNFNVLQAPELPPPPFKVVRKQILNAITMLLNTFDSMINLKTTLLSKLVWWIQYLEYASRTP